MNTYVADYERKALAVTISIVSHVLLMLLLFWLSKVYIPHDATDDSSSQDSPYRSTPAPVYIKPTTPAVPQQQSRILTDLATPEEEEMPQQLPAPAAPAYTQEFTEPSQVTERQEEVQPHTEETISEELDGGEATVGQSAPLPIASAPPRAETPVRRPTKRMRKGPGKPGVLGKQLLQSIRGLAALDREQKNVGYISTEALEQGEARAIAQSRLQQWRDAHYISKIESELLTACKRSRRSFTVDTSMKSKGSFKIAINADGSVAEIPQTITGRADIDSAIADILRSMSLPPLPAHLNCDTYYYTLTYNFDIDVSNGKAQTIRIIYGGSL